MGLQTSDGMMTSWSGEKPVDSLQLLAEVAGSIPAGPTKFVNGLIALKARKPIDTVKLGEGHGLIVQKVLY